MPFYEYQCTKCEHHLEAMQKFSDKPLRKCPSCGRSTLKKLMSAPVFRLKGSGWYETDFKSDKDAQRNLAVEKDDAPAKTEAEPAAKVDAKDGGEKKVESAKPEAAKTDKAKPEAAKSSAAKAGRGKAKTGSSKSKIAPRRKAGR